MLLGERYYLLLREAQEAADAVDNFDLVSHPGSVAKWRALLDANVIAQHKLIAYIRKPRKYERR